MLSVYYNGTDKYTGDIIVVGNKGSTRVTVVEGVVEGAVDTKTSNFLSIDDLLAIIDSGLVTQGTVFKTPFIGPVQNREKKEDVNVTELSEEKAKATEKGDVDAEKKTPVKKSK